MGRRTKALEFFLPSFPRGPARDRAARTKEGSDTPGRVQRGRKILWGDRGSRRTEKKPVSYFINSGITICRVFGNCKSDKDSDSEGVQPLRARERKVVFKRCQWPSWGIVTFI